jgi:hypothetical protein
MIDLLVAISTAGKPRWRIAAATIRKPHQSAMIVQLAGGARSGHVQGQRSCQRQKLSAREDALIRLWFRLRRDRTRPDSKIPGRR